MIAELPAHFEPIQGADLKRVLDAIWDRPVTSLPTPEQTLGHEARVANGRASAAKVAKTHQQRRAGGRPEFDRQAVGDDLARGMSVLEVTVKHGISDTTAKKIKRERNITLNARGGRPTYDQIGALRDIEQGMSTAEVSAKYGVCHQTINKLRRERGDRV